MPPKRGRPPGRGRGTPRATSRARGTPGPSGLDGSRESQSPAPPSSETRVRAQITPGPSKYSTSYGSPATLTAVRRVKTGSAIGSIGSALKNVQTSNEQDRLTHTERLAAEARSRGEPAPAQSPAQRPPTADDGGSNQDDDSGLDQLSQAMPPPPRPRQSQRLAKASASAANIQRATQGPRAASVQPDTLRPDSSPAGIGSNAGRLGSEPLHSDAISHRSFIEESELYGSAALATPNRRPFPSQPVVYPEVLRSHREPLFQPRRSPRRQLQPAPEPDSEPEPEPQQSPSPSPSPSFSSSPSPSPSPSPMPRRSAPAIAARTGASRERTASPTISTQAARVNQQTQAPVNLSDSIDEDDEEDPLHNPTPRGLRTNRGLSATSQTQTQSQPVQGDQPPDLTTRVQGIEQYVSNRDKGLTTDASGTSGGEAVQDLKTTAKRTPGRRGGRQSRWPNPFQDARTGDLLLPRPDRAGSEFRAATKETAKPTAGTTDSTAGTANPTADTRVPDTSKQSLLNRLRSQFYSASSTGETGQSTQQGDSKDSKRPDGSLPRAEGGSTAGFATSLGVPATSGQQSLFTQNQSSSPVPTSVDSLVDSPAGATSRLSQQNKNIVSRPAGTPSKDNTRPAQPKVQSIDYNRPQQGSDSDSSSRAEAAAADGPDASRDQTFVTRVMKWLRWAMHLGNWPRKLRKALQYYGLLVLVCWFFLIMLEACLPTNRWEGIQVGKDYQYYGMSLENWRQNILQFVPWIVLHPFAVLTGNLDYADFRDQLSRMELKQHSNANKLRSIASATNQMRHILPELIKINVGERHGDWAIDDWFWHVLNEEMSQGSFVWSLLTVAKSEDGSYTIPDRDWAAIKQRIQKERLLISDRPTTEQDPLKVSNEVMSYVELSVSQAFRDWLAQNEKDVKRVLGKDEGLPSATYKDLYGDVEKIIAQRLKALGLQEDVVTKDMFLEKMEHEFEQRMPSVMEEFETLRGKLDQALGIAMDAKMSAETPPGLSRSEVSELVDESVRRAIADAQLEAMAKGSIKSHLNNELNQRKNYFSAIRGAVVDPRLTSGTYDWRPQQVVKQEKSVWNFWKSDRSKQPVYREGGKHSGLPFAPSFALDRWEEDGECWCAGHGDAKNDTHWADLSIFTTEPVVPQHLVIEHIGRGATFDPQAMPKDIEFWIQPPSDKRARTLHDWSKSRWADIRFGPGAKLVQKGFLKVGEFQFDASIGKGESQVFKLSDELLGMDAQTRQVLVRAKSNYGAEDHTCFYRLRLFGEEGRGRGKNSDAR